MSTPRWYRRAIGVIAYRWPLAARLVGLALGTAELIAWATGVKPESGVMTFAAGLIMVPSVANAQRDRNERRRR